MAGEVYRRAEQAWRRVEGGSGGWGRVEGGSGLSSCESLPMSYINSHRSEAALELLYSKDAIPILIERLRGCHHVDGVEPSRWPSWSRR